MGKVERRPQAVRDLLEIWDYIARDNGIAADHLLRLFDEKLALLSNAPGVGKSREDLSPGQRSFAVGALHGRRNIDLLAELGLFDEGG